MATYTELAGLPDEGGWGAFFDKVVVASIIKATAILDAVTPPAEALAWAQTALDSPRMAAKGIVWYVIGSNTGISIAAILSASDSAVQSNVNDAVDAIYGS